MGAQDFMVVCAGDTAKLAFDEAVGEARYLHGHGGYTGTIAEKGSFVPVGSAADEEEAREKAQTLIDNRDPRIEDKWGPAGCIEIAEPKNTFLFFGTASS